MKLLYNVRYNLVYLQTSEPSRLWNIFDTLSKMSLYFVENTRKGQSFNLGHNVHCTNVHGQKECGEVKIL